MDRTKKLEKGTNVCQEGKKSFWEFDFQYWNWHEGMIYSKIVDFLRKLHKFSYQLEKDPLEHLSPNNQKYDSSEKIFKFNLNYPEYRRNSTVAICQ